MLVHSLLLLQSGFSARRRLRAACDGLESLLLLLMLETTEAVAQPGLGGCRRARRAASTAAPPLPPPTLLYASLQLDLFPALFNVAHRQEPSV